MCRKHRYRALSQWRAKGEKTVHVVSQSSLQSHYGGIALDQSISAADFKKGWLCLQSFAHFNYHQEHTDYLIAFNGSDYVEIGLVADYTLLGCP